MRAGVGVPAGAEVVGRRQELRLLHHAVSLRRPVLFLGPPGVSKTTMLRALAHELGTGPDAFHWVTGDEQISAHALVGTFDPGLTLRAGYRAEHFQPGPLVRAMRAGGILYVEELNRAPSGALNVLLTSLSEGYLEVPHLGRVEAAPGFMVVGAANPFDDVGTARLSRGLLDRFLVVEIDYQPRDEEIEIVRRHTAADLPRLCALAVDVARRTRGHPELRHGASVRAAIDLVGLVAAHLDHTQDAGEGPQRPGARVPREVHLDREELRALVCAAFVGRVRPRPTIERSVCDLVMDLLDGLVQETLAGDLDAALVVSGARGPGVDDEAGSGAGERDEEALAEGGQGSEGQAPEEARRDQVPGLERPGGTDTPGPSRSVPMVSRSQPPARGQVREAFDTAAEAPLASLEEVIRRAAELTLALRGDLDHRSPAGAGRWLHAAPWAPGGPGTLDVATTLATYVARAGDVRGSDLTVLQRAPEQVDYLILVDHSGSMAGRKLGLAAVMAGVVAQLSATGRARYGVVAFDEDLTTLKALDVEEDVADVVERILRLPEGKATDLAAALRVATEITGAVPGASETVLISDCMPTRGTTGFEGLAALARRVPSLHICYIDEPLPAIQLFGSGPELNLYQWWARRWVGDDRVHTVDHPDELGDVIQRISTVQEGGLT